ncbi:hypothetical protein GIY30_23075 [Gordonia sp. HNM0687]|uniref:Uncharacterized protein n=1 Tax=Gordonia mangrovi TaxID=2665643 RepID=A0A6L7GVW4_9ACTN|nr:hypothetical protein [Gordonia mangrovi]MXP24214.1 hypothetical protein [Gordonia mangrovi]UVF76895.1 hypothetical protein NWF22_16315 [Gordonia mangrovi]
MGEQLFVRPAAPSADGQTASFDGAAIRRFVARHLLPIRTTELDADDAPTVDGQYRVNGTTYVDRSGIRVDVGPEAIVVHDSGVAAEQTIFAALTEIGGIAIDPEQALAISCDATWLDATRSPIDTLVVVSTATELSAAMRAPQPRSGIVDGRR